MFEKQYIGHVTHGSKIKRAVWNCTCLVLFRPFGTKLFRLWRLLLLKIFGAEVAWSAEVYASSKIWAPWLLTMEENSCIGPHTIVYNQARVTLHRQACLSQYAYICTAGHETNDVNNATKGLVVAEVLLEEGAWVGTRAFVGQGVIIGKHAVVGACACVFKDVPESMVVGGNPAQVIRSL